jgi:hypothetical protein
MLLNQIFLRLLEQTAKNKHNLLGKIYKVAKESELYHATHMPIFSELKNNHMGVNSQRH